MRRFHFGANLSEDEDDDDENDDNDENDNNGENDDNVVVVKMRMIEGAISRDLICQ